MVVGTRPSRPAGHARPHLPPLSLRLGSTAASFPRLMPSCSALMLDGRAERLAAPLVRRAWPAAASPPLLASTRGLLRPARGGETTACAGTSTPPPLPAATGVAASASGGGAPSSARWWLAAGRPVAAVLGPSSLPPSCNVLQGQAARSGNHMSLPAVACTFPSPRMPGRWPAGLAIPAAPCCPVWQDARLQAANTSGADRPAPRAAPTPTHTCPPRCLWMRTGILNICAPLGTAPQCWPSAQRSVLEPCLPTWSAPRLPRSSWDPWCGRDAAGRQPARWPGQPQCPPALKPSSLNRRRCCGQGGTPERAVSLQLTVLCSRQAGHVGVV